MLSFALAEGKAWNPKLSMDRSLPAVVHLLQSNCPDRALTRNPPVFVVAAVSYKEAIGKTDSTAVTHWGHAVLFREDWHRNLGSMGAHIQEIPVQAGDGAVSKSLETLGTRHTRASWRGRLGSVSQATQDSRPRRKWGPHRAVLGLCFSGAVLLDPCRAVGAGQDLRAM